MLLPLTAQNVRDIGERCISRPNEPGHIAIEMISGTSHFNQARLEEHRHVIDALLAQLPRAFRVVEYGSPPGGGGWTFLNACFNQDGTQWGEQAHVDVLVGLGIGIGSVEWSLPRDMWDALPGGMPYFQIMPPKDKNDAVWLDFTEQLSRGLYRKK